MATDDDELDRAALVDRIKRRVDELESEITDADETDRAAVSGIVRDIKDRLAELERWVRRQ